MKIYVETRAQNLFSYYTVTTITVEGLPGVLGNKGTEGKYRREQGNMTPVLGNTGT